MRYQYQYQYLEDLTTDCDLLVVEIGDGVIEDERLCDNLTGVREWDTREFDDRVLICVLNDKD